MQERHATLESPATGDALALLSEAEAELGRIAAADRSSGVFRVPESQRLAMLVAVREAVSAGLSEQAIAACMATVRPILHAMSGSDYFAVGPKRDLAALERFLRANDVPHAIALIRDLSRVRWWVTVTSMSLLCAATLAFWLLRR
jgi:hypothetical protein